MDCADSGKAVMVDGHTINMLAQQLNLRTFFSLHAGFMYTQSKSVNVGRLPGKKKGQSTLLADSHTASADSAQAATLNLGVHDHSSLLFARSQTSTSYRDPAREAKGGFDGRGGAAFKLHQTTSGGLFLIPSIMSRPNLRAVTCTGDCFLCLFFFTQCSAQAAAFGVFLTDCNRDGLVSFLFITKQMSSEGSLEGIKERVTKITRACKMIKETRGTHLPIEQASHGMDGCDLLITY